jgi:putative acetyltransferase
MDFIIRPPEVTDAKALHKIRISDGARENTLGLVTSLLTEQERRLVNLGANDHVLVAEVEGKAIGIIGLRVNPSVRMNHMASLGITIHPDYQGQGIGSALIDAILELADNWLMLVRVELEVFTDNQIAVNLYKSKGFVIEGTKKYATKRYGRYDPEYLMARYNQKILGGNSNGNKNGE